MMEINKGKLFLISGPSGVGKGAIVKRIISHKELNLTLSISATTRKKRDGEIEGSDYFFISKDEFKKLIDNENLLEYSEHFGNYYGTPRHFVEENITKGKNVLLEIEFNGAEQITKSFPGVISIILLPPSWNELERRLALRKTETKEMIEKRLLRAKTEIEKANLYKYKFINENLDVLESEITKLIKEKSK